MCPVGTINVLLRGHTGQSFGFSLAKGVRVTHGDVVQVQLKRHKYKRAKHPYGGDCVDDVPSLQGDAMLDPAACNWRCQLRDAMVACPGICPDAENVSSCFALHTHNFSTIECFERSVNRPNSCRDPTEDGFRYGETGNIGKEAVKYSRANGYAYCPIKCKETEYRISKETRASIPDGIYQYLGTGFTSAGSWLLNFELESTWPTVHESTPKATLWDVFSGIGGNMGLFVGMSIMSWCEVAEFVAVLASLSVLWCWRLVRREPAQPAQHHSCSATAQGTSTETAAPQDAGAYLVRAINVERA